MIVMEKDDLTSERDAKHLLAGQNTQQSLVWNKLFVVTENKDTYVNTRTKPV